MSEPIDLLHELRAQRKKTNRNLALASRKNVLDPYMASDAHGNLIVAPQGTHSSHALAGVLEQSETETLTATAYTLLNLLGERAENASWLLELTDRLAKSISAYLTADYSDVLVGISKKEQSGNTSAAEVAAPRKKTAPRLNAYNSSIPLLAIARLAHYQQASQTCKLDDELKDLGNGLAQQIAKWLSVGKGRIWQLYPTSSHGNALHNTLHGKGNAYLTHLCASALCEWYALNCCAENIHQKVFDALMQTFDLTAVALFRLMGAYQTGVKGRADAIEMGCALSTLGKISSTLDLQDGFITRILKTSYRIFCDDFMLPNGTFAPMRAAFEFSKGRDRIFVNISSVELGLVLLNGIGDLLEPHELLVFDPLIDNISANYHGPLGWGAAADKASDPDQAPERQPDQLPDRHANVFFVTAILAFLRKYRQEISRSITMIARSELGVPNNYPKKAHEFPDAVAGTIHKEVIGPIQLGKREIASMSLVLGGPPGAAKTSIAQKLAQSLQWPLLRLELGHFLGKGIAGIEIEAERIFDLLMELEDIVVLFDEIEEVILDRSPGSGEREARFLTSAMLPRFQRLRDKGKIVFLIATNYPDRLDSAATRPGRIDSLIVVKQPDSQARNRLLETFIGDFIPKDRVADVQEILLGENGMSENCAEFTIGHLKSLVIKLAQELTANSALDKMSLGQLTVKLIDDIRPDFSHYYTDG
ncbi:MAG: ATP-binding protein [Coriobacteriales bacterium]|nr:ATP-binding protein [Coriobacteriales bacterium]